MRAPGGVHLPRPFTSDLSGQDFAKLIMAGWAPAGFALGISIGARHDDWLTINQTSWGAGNSEVVGYTDLVDQGRHDARAQLERDVTRLGAEGVVVSSMDMRVRDRECPMQEHRRRPHRGGNDHRHGHGPVRRAAPSGARLQPCHHVPRPAAPPGGADQAGQLTGRPAASRAHNGAERSQGRAMTDQQQSTEFGVLGVPQDAMKRLAELRPGKPGSIFTSDLSVNEFLLVRECGFRPLGLVLGSSIYHVGLQVGRWGKNQELDVLSQAMYHARELAMTRMEAEAQALGADGIVGVRLDVEMKEFGNDIAEFIAVGTAVHAEPEAGGGGVKEWRNNKNLPFTSDLSGQDFWTLIRAGYAPLGMVMGSCVYHIAHQKLGGKLGNIGRNVELEQFTQALYDARELAMSRMQAEAEELHAEGIVGVQLRQHSHTWGSHTTEFFAIGTAVRPLRDDHVIERPTMVLSLDS